MSKNRSFAIVSAVTGGLLAAAFLPMAVAVADEEDFTPDLTTFTPRQVEGYPPLINEVTGPESWSLSDITTNTVLSPTDVLGGTDTQTTIGSFTNDDFLTSSSFTVLASPSFFVPAGSQLDLANFGLGYENEWLDIPSGTNTGISDLFITPFGDFALFGSGFSELATAVTP